MSRGLVSLCALTRWFRGAPLSDNRPLNPHTLERSNRGLLSRGVVSVNFKIKDDPEK